MRLAGDASSGPPQRAQAHLVAGTYFAVMGVSAALGRTLSDDDDRTAATPVAVVSDGFWKARLHADPSIVGKVAIVNGTAFTIVGVAPPEFFGERVRRPPDFWLPLAFQPQIELRPSFLERRDAYWLNIIGRLPAGVSRSSLNVVLITLDTTRADRIGAYGFTGIETPNLDRLAREGVQKSIADYCAAQPAPATIQICSTGPTIR